MIDRRAHRMSGSLLLSAGWSTASSATQSAMRTAATAQPSGAYSASAGVQRGTCRDPNRSPGCSASLRRHRLVCVWCLAMLDCSATDRGAWVHGGAEDTAKHRISPFGYQAYTFCCERCRTRCRQVLTSRLALLQVLLTKCLQTRSARPPWRTPTSAPPSVLAAYPLHLRPAALALSNRNRAGMPNQTDSWLLRASLPSPQQLAGCLALLAYQAARFSAYTHLRRVGEGH